MLSAIKRIPAQVFLFLVGLCAMFGAAQFGLLFWMAKSANDLARESSIQLTETTLSNMIESAATITQDYAYWEEAYDWVLAGDGDAVYRNLGVTASNGEIFQA